MCLSFGVDMVRNLWKKGSKTTILSIPMVEYRYWILGTSTQSVLDGRYRYRYRKVNTGTQCSVLDQLQCFGHNLAISHPN